jgi:hypothetical protein
MQKTKMYGEKMLVKQMMSTGKPYKNPEQLSAEIERNVR